MHCPLWNFHYTWRAVKLMLCIQPRPSFFSCQWLLIQYICKLQSSIFVWIIADLCRMPHCTLVSFHHIPRSALTCHQSVWSYDCVTGALAACSQCMDLVAFLQGHSAQCLDFASTPVKQNNVIYNLFFFDRIFWLYSALSLYCWCYSYKRNYETIRHNVFMYVCVLDETCPINLLHPTVWLL